MTQSSHLEDRDKPFAELFADAIPLKSSLKARKIPPAKRTTPIPKYDEPDTRIRYIATDDLDVLDAPSSYLKLGCDKNLLRKLRKGAYSVGDEIDIHGCNRFEAQVVLSQFFAKTHTNCVLVIHGRGLTLSGRPILKTVARAWLEQQEFVLAYCEAPSSLGGEGAVMVLIKS